MSSPPIADVCLLLEGTYPYVLGGVSAWVDQIIRGLPELKFTLFFIGSQKELAKKLLYQLPPNVIGQAEIYLHDRLSESDLTPAKPPALLRQALYRRLGEFYLAPEMAEKVRRFWPLLEALREAEGRFTFGNLCRDREAWDVLQETYQQFCPDISFIDFFWTVRFLHLPLWTCWRAAPRLPPARVYHSISTGYAGLLGAIAARHHRRPYLLTEHGIYTKERFAEISQADWIYEGEQDLFSFAGGLGALKEMWIGLFQLLGQVTYDAADPIITLYEGNALTQVEFGAVAEKILVIPNGIEPDKFDPIRAEVQARWQPAPALKTVGFVGRVVPIKDVKTLLRAARLVCERCPDVQFLIAGPYSEDPAYFDECQKIVKLLNIDTRVHFLGMQKLMEVLPKMDVMVLTSISEGLPLVILEAYAAGIPVVATDVGACRELIFGRSPEDKALGRAGRLTKILSPQETAAALISILQDPARWRKAGEAGRQRVRHHYSMSKLLQSYRELYERLAAPPDKQE